MEANEDDEAIVIRIKETNRIVGDEDIDSIVVVKIDHTIVDQSRQRRIELSV